MAEAEEQVDEGPSLLQLAVAEAFKPVEHLESATEFARIQEKVVQHLSRAGRKVQADSKSFLEMAEVFADTAMNAVFTAFSDKAWLKEIDFVMPVTTAMRERFPKFADMSHFEKTAADACERAIDAKHAENVMWECVSVMVDKKSERTKLYEAIDMARKTAMAFAIKGAGGSDSLENFATKWIKGTVMSLKASHGGRPENGAPAKALIQLFNSLCEKGALPALLTSAFGQPPADWPHLEEAVEEAYREAAPKGKGKGKGKEQEEEDGEEPAAKRARTREEGYGRVAPGPPRPSSGRARCGA
eukprot:SRR837773.698.p1 GENE.SRR837773.698~~SRR837773.698.p1  ORF type:complete len:316 (-),score=128.87 SRR837773.698:43-945(-)